MSQNKILACLGHDVVSKGGIGDFERRRRLDGGGTLPKVLGTDILSYKRSRPWYSRQSESRPVTLSSHHGRVSVTVREKSRVSTT